MPDDVINELGDRLTDECSEWAPTFDSLEIDDDITRYHDNFLMAIQEIETLSKMKVDDTVRNCFLKMLYVNVITALETYLSDAFIDTVINRLELIQRFVENTKEYKAEKIPLSEVFKVKDGIGTRVHKDLNNVVWHHLVRAKKIYFSTLGIKLPNLGVLLAAVEKRHDIVHRNGKTRDGKEILISELDVSDLIGEVESFVQNIDAQVSEVKSHTRTNTDEPSTADGMNI